MDSPENRPPHLRLLSRNHLAPGLNTLNRAQDWEGNRTVVLSTGDGEALCSVLFWGEETYILTRTMSRQLLPGETFKLFSELIFKLDEKNELRVLNQAQEPICAIGRATEEVELGAAQRFRRKAISGEGSHEAASKPITNPRSVIRYSLLAILAVAGIGVGLPAAVDKGAEGLDAVTEMAARLERELMHYFGF